jgi:hypothetical protein
MSTLLTSARAVPLITSLRNAADLGLEHRPSNPMKDRLFQFAGYSAQTKRYQLTSAAAADWWPGGRAEYERTRHAWRSTSMSLRDVARCPVEQVLTLPNVLLQNTTEIVLPSLNAAKHYAESLIIDPRNALTRDALSNNLQLLSSNFAQFGGFTTPLLDVLTSAGATFDGHALLMADIAKTATRNVWPDEHQHQTLLTDVTQQLEQLIDNATELAVTIAGGSLTGVVGLVMGCVDIALASGAVSMAMVVPSGLIVADGVACVALDSSPIQRQRTTIDALNRRLSRTEGYGVLVNAMAGSLCGFGRQFGTLRSALGPLIEPWGEASAYFAATMNQVNDYIAPTMSDWVAIDADLHEISRQWSALIGCVRELMIDPQVSPDSRLTLGMNEQQVGRALARAGSHALTDFLAH